MLHVQRRKDVLVEVVIEAFTGQTLHDVSRQGSTIIRVRRRRACCEYPGWNPLFQQGFVTRRFRVFRDDALGLLLEAGHMLHQIAHGDRLAVARRDLEIEILVDVAVQVYFPLLHQLHDGGPGDQLGNRTGSEQGEFRIHRRVLFDIRVTVAALGQNFSVFHDGENGARDVAGVQRVRHVAIEPGVDILGGQRHRGGGSRRLSTDPSRRQ
jgi:hypothetical protein